MIDVSIVIISKDERFLADTLDALASHESSYRTETIVVDASQGRLAGVERDRPAVRWLDYARPRDMHKRVTIPEQRNVGVAAAEGRVVVFIDAGCTPEPGWLDELVGPITQGLEQVTSGHERSSVPSPYDDGREPERGYVPEAATINMAFDREVLTTVGGFDETFSYGSDVDFSWRLNDAGIKILRCPTAVIVANWEGGARQRKRARQYGEARARLYRKHPRRLRSVLRDDPLVVVYPLFLVLLPLTLRFRAYPLLLLVPWWRARGHRPTETVIDHLHYGVGVLEHLVRR